MMFCYVSQPNSVVIEVEVDPKANGQECLDKVCSQLGIVEQDYFGLQYRGGKGEALWLNNRNRIDRQLSGIGHSTPYRFQLRVKFYIQPHLLLQDTSRHLFFLQVKNELQSGKMTIEDEGQLVRMLSLMAQAECGDQTNNGMLLEFYQKTLQAFTEPTKDLVVKVAEEHHNLQGMSKRTAEYRVLQEASTLQNYGMEFHKAKDSNGDFVYIGVGPDGVFLYSDARHLQLQQRLEYAIIHKAVHNGRKCLIYKYEEDGEVSEIELKMLSSNSANALYRCITEMHSFFRCDTVNDEVSSQVSRDLKGTLASMFNEHTTLGQDYVFDVKQTCREVYDSTRRKLLKRQLEKDLNVVESKDFESNMETSDHVKDATEVKVLKERLEKMEDSFICRVCMDKHISTALSPCWHLVCCEECAQRLNECPLCRTAIDNVQKVFMATAMKT